MTDPLDARLGAALTPPDLPDGHDPWPDIRAALARRARRHRALRAALGAAGLVLLTATAVVAGSPDVRARLADAVSVGGGPRGLSSVNPAPPFTVYQPAYLPEGMRLVGQAYRPSAGGLTASGGGAFQKGDDVGQALAEEAGRRVRRWQDEHRGALLVLVYGAPPDRWVELVERPAAEGAVPGGDPTTVRGRAAARVRADGREVLVWREEDTLIELASTLGAAETARLAASLAAQPVAVATPEARPLVVTIVPPPLPKLRTVERPAFDAAAVAARCGPWDAGLYAAKPTASYELATCYGLAAAGIGRPGGGYGLSRSAWREVAEQHGLDAALLPDPGTTVWLVTASEMDGSGAVVALDVATGAPAVVVRLRPSHSPPLARWVAATEQPGLDRRLAAAVRCARWAAEAPYPAAQVAARCRARAFAGGPERWFEAQRFNWAQAAHELGLARDPGPAPEAPVWFAASESDVVVLDAATGEALVVARLRGPT